MLNLSNPEVNGKKDRHKDQKIYVIAYLYISFNSGTNFRSRTVRLGVLSSSIQTVLYSRQWKTAKTCLNNATPTIFQNAKRQEGTEAWSFKYICGNQCKVSLII